MSSQAKESIPPGQFNASSSGQNGSSDLNFTSSDSNDPALPLQQSRSPHQSSFRWPSEPLNKGRPSLPQDSQQSVDDANRDILQRITDADQDATSQPLRAQSGLDQPRLSAHLTTTLNNLEEERRAQLSPTNTSFLVPSVSTLPMLSPQPQNMDRTSSHGTNKSTGSDRPDAQPSAPQYPSFLPDIFRNAASMPLALLRSLIPDNALPAPADEGLSASTLQVPVTSFNALLEACKAFEWLATQASQFDSWDKGSASRRNSSAPQPSEDNVEFTCFDYLQLLQKVADVVSGLAAARGIDLILDLDPQLQGTPVENQRHYKLGSCAVWADRLSLTFLFMSCLSRLLHNAPVQSTVVVTTILTPQEETIARPDSNPEMKLMVLSLGLRLILPRTVAASQDLMSSISGTPASLLLDAFGARLTTEQSTSGLPGNHDRAVVDHSISVSVGQLADSQEDSSAQQHKSKPSKHSMGPNQDELVDFASTLRGNKVALYSTSQSIFARHLSSFLSGLGCDVAPVFTDSVDESSFDGNDHVFGKQAHTAVALTSGRPALVSYTSDIDKRARPTQPSPSNGSSYAVQGKAGAQTVTAVDTAVLDPITGVPVTFDNSSHRPPLSEQKPSQSPGDPRPLNLETQIEPVGRRVVPFSYVIIDDDIVTLQKELLRIRSAVPLLKSALSSKSTPNNPLPKQLKASRPTLDHRTKSSPQVNRLMASQLDTTLSRSFGSAGSTLMKDGGEASDESSDSIDESVSQTIIFFTSMKSYQLVRDTVQPIIDSASFRGVSSPPEIMVLPKPAGAKRILTALHAAQHKPIVQLPFLPIATAPLSPLTSHSKTWWTPNSSPQQDGQGIMTLTRRQTGSTDTDFDTEPSTPWSPVEPIRAPGGLPTPEIPLTSENLPLAGEPSAKGASVRTITKGAAVPGNSASTSATTTKSAPRSTVSRQTGSKANANATLEPNAADPALTHKSTQAASVASGSTSAPSSVHQSRSQAVSSPMPADALEYFSETAAKMGGSAASGMVIQSPDGRPAGIFFQPKASASTPSIAGSKPALSRGVSASSLRRGHQTPSEHSDRSEPATRDRRLTNRSNGSSGGSIRGSGAEGNQMRVSNLSSLAEHAASANSTEASDSRVPPLQIPNAGKYPSGSMFAPQVGIHSVLNSSRPPMTTPLGPSLSSQPQDAGASASSSRESTSAQGASETGNDDKHSNSKPDSTAAAGSTGEGAKAVNSAGPGLAKSGEGAAGRARSSVANESRPRQPAASGSNSAAASPVAHNSSNAASRVKARQSFGAVTASPSDSKTKPSAVPQSGFMMGMGFTASARRGRGPKKAPVREAVLPPIKVLIVEDNPINQRILSMFMGKKKIKYDVANNGREAVEKWKTGGYHLILMDIQLPVMDGIEATKEIRKLERNANIGILPNTPPASADSRVEPLAVTSSSSSSSLAGGSRTLQSKGLMKHAVAGSGGSASQSNDQQQQQQQQQSSVRASGGPHASSSSALVNGVGDSNRVHTARRGGGGSINPFRASVIIVALTASVLSSDRVEALAAGCNDFLNKPVSLPWLNQKILEWGSMMYLMYSGLSSDDIHLGNMASSAAGGGAGANRTERAQLHLGFGYGPAEKAKALANNLHLGDTLALKKKKRSEEKGKMEANQKGRDANVEQRKQQEGKKEVGAATGSRPAESKDEEKQIDEASGSK